MLKAKELPRWLQGEADKLGVELDRDGAQALVGLVGERQQRLLRELEKLALELGPGARIGARRRRGRRGALLRAPGLGPRRRARRRRRPGRDARLPRRSARRASRSARLVGLLARRVRDVLAIAQRLEAGEAPPQIKASMKGSPWAPTGGSPRRAARTPTASAARSRRSPTSSSPRTATASCATAPRRSARSPASRRSASASAARASGADRAGSRRRCSG